MSVGLVLVSHSAQLAAGCAEVAAQMAPDVSIEAAGGTDDGRIGTSFDLVERAIAALLGGGADGVVLVTDLGSATLTAESVLELLDDDRVVLADVPFVEGAVAGAVAAQTGADVVGVVAAARTAVSAFEPAVAAVRESSASDAVRRTLTLVNALGLHARPAAVMARKAADFDAEITVNGVEADSVLELMGLGLAGGAEVELVAVGAQAQEAVDALAADIEAGFGEE